MLSRGWFHRSLTDVISCLSLPGAVAGLNVMTSCSTVLGAPGTAGTDRKMRSQATLKENCSRRFSDLGT